MRGALLSTFGIADVQIKMQLPVFAPNVERMGNRVRHIRHRLRAQRVRGATYSP